MQNSTSHANRIFRKCSPFIPSTIQNMKPPVSAVPFSGNYRASQLIPQTLEKTLTQRHHRCPVYTRPNHPSSALSFGQSSLYKPLTAASKSSLQRTRKGLARRAYETTARGPRGFSVSYIYSTCITLFFSTSARTGLKLLAFHGLKYSF